MQQIVIEESQVLVRSELGPVQPQLVFFFFRKKNISLKHLKLPENHFKTNLFFSIFGGGDPPPVRSWSDGRLELQTSLEKPSDTSQITRIIQNSFHGM